MKTIVAGFVPVIHAGYLSFFRRYWKGQMLLFSRELYGEFDRLTREIRALQPVEVAECLRALGIFETVQIAGPQEIARIPATNKIVMPDEDISRHVASKYLLRHDVRFESVFLRFDMPKTLSQEPPEPDRTVEVAAMDREFMAVALNAAKRSPDWWRQVGVVAAKDGHVLFVEFNHHMPSEHSLYAMGDPRNNFKAGEQIEMSCSHHSERRVIARAAAEGVSLNGSFLYVTVFPCPGCAYSIIEAGIRRVYYAQGYSRLEACKALKARGVEIVHVKQKPD